MIRTAVIGLGKMGISHCAILNAHRSVDLVGLCDANGFIRKALSKYSGLQTFKSHTELFEQAAPQAVVVATPTSSHFEIISDALQRGIHVFAEKPLCLDAAQGKALAQMATERNLINQVGYHNRFIGTFREARNLLQTGVIGDVLHYRVEAYGPVVVRPKFGTWRSKAKEGGGCTRDYASHVLDLVNFLLGSPDRVAGTVLKSVFSKDVEDAVYATLLHSSGLTGQLSVNWSDESFRKMTTMIEIFGSRGKIFADRQECRIYLRKGEKQDGLREGWNIRYITELQDPVDYYLRGEEYSAQIDHFIECIEARSKETLSPFSSAARTDEVIEQLEAEAALRV